MYKETISSLKEVATWQNEKFVSRRKTRRSSPTEQDDPLGLHVEERDSGKISEEQLQMMYPESSGNIGADNFQPGYFLLDRHRSTTFEDLKAGLNPNIIINLFFRQMKMQVTKIFQFHEKTFFPPRQI